MSQHSARGPKWEATRLAVLERDSYTCQHCGEHGDTVDHVIPKVMGGLDTMDNLIALCRPCNSKKGAQLQQRIAGVNPRWLDSL